MPAFIIQRHTLCAHSFLSLSLITFFFFFSLTLYILNSRTLHIHTDTIYYILSSYDALLYSSVYVYLYIYVYLSHYILYHTRAGRRISNAAMNSRACADRAPVAYLALYPSREVLSRFSLSQSAQGCRLARAKRGTERFVRGYAALSGGGGCSTV